MPDPNSRSPAARFFGPVPAAEVMADLAAFVRASPAGESVAGILAFGRAVLVPPDEAEHVRRALMVPATVQAGTGPSWQWG